MSDKPGATEPHGAATPPRTGTRWTSAGLLVSVPVFPWAMVLAQQIDPTSLSGGAGWVGAGLLGLVLAWLLWVHLPAKDKQIKEMIESRDKLALDMAKVASDCERERRADFREALKAVAEQTGGEIKHLATAVEELRRVMHAASGVVGYEARTAAHHRELGGENK